METYQKPNWFTAKVANPAVQFFIRTLGLSPQGAQVLEVKGRKSGTPRTVPVNPIMVDGKRYLLAPRGETQWVRNFRAVKFGRLMVGKKVEPVVLVRELDDSEKAPVLKAYLDKYHWQVGSQVGVPKDATLEQLAGIAPNHPVFEIATREYV